MSIIISLIFYTMPFVQYFRINRIIKIYKGEEVKGGRGDIFILVAMTLFFAFIIVGNYNNCTGKVDYFNIIMTILLLISLYILNFLSRRKKGKKSKIFYLLALTVTEWGTGFFFLMQLIKIGLDCKYSDYILG